MLIEAVYRLLSQNSSIAHGSIYESNYNYDVVEFTSAAIADYAYYLLLGIKEAKDAAGDAFATDAKFIARRDAFLQVIRDMDSFKGTNLNFRLGKWTGQARAAAGEVQNATTATADWYEFNNARTLITTWGDYWQNYAGLRDYSYRSWQGLLKDYYLPRWEYYFANNCKHPGVSDEKPDGDAQNYFFFEWNWAHGMTHSVGDTQVSATRLAQGAAGYSYSATPEGNTVTLANGLLGSYIIPARIDGNTHYLYRHLSNDLTSVYRVNVEQGAVVNFAGLIGDLFGDLTNATISGGFIESGDDVTSIKVRNNAANGVSADYGAVITLADQTTIAFTVVVRPAELNTLPQTAGVYHIKYGGNPIFLAYADKGELLDGTTDLAGYHLVNPNAEGVPAAAQGDELFTITYNSEKGGYTLSAQGMYLHSTPAKPETWQSMILSADKSMAGIFLFEVSGAADVYKLRSNIGNEWYVRYVNSWGKVFGNDMYYIENLSTFTIERVTEYMLTIPAGGVATLCLPFNVVLPAGVEAYDVTAVGDDDNGNTVYGATLLAESGEKVKAGTPVLIKGTPGTYALGVTVDGTNAIGSLHGSLLIGNYVKRSLVPGNGSNLYTLNGVDATFNLLDAETEIAANSAWLELGEAIETPIPEGNPAEIELPAETPVAGKVYRIRNYIKSRYIVNDRLNITLPMAVEDDDMDALWVCTGGEPGGQYTFVSALGTAALGWCGLAENAVGFVLDNGVGNGTSAMQYDGQYLAVAVDDGGVPSLASSNEKVQAANLSTDWYFESVNDATVAFERAFISGYHWGTLYLPYAVKVPENMTAYYATVDDVNVANKVITLNNVGNVIPASTPVLLNRSENMNASYRFEYTQEVATVVDGNIFEGRIMQSLVECVEGKNYYMLLKAGNGEAFYWVFKEYDANGNLYPEQNKTHIKCEANKGFLALPAATTNAGALSFRYGGDTTEVDEIESENGKVKTIYDLQGRKLSEITEAGVYIVDGKKVVVK